MSDNIVDLHPPKGSVDDVLDSVSANRENIASVLVCAVTQEGRIEFGHTDHDSMELLGLLEVCKDHIIREMRANY